VIPAIRAALLALLVLGCDAAPRGTSQTPEGEHRPQGNATLDSAAPTPGHGLARPGSWEPTRTAEGRGFTLEIPAVAKAERSAGSEDELRVTDLPGCRWFCGVTVRLRDVDLDSAVKAETQPT
jgi:hypothetical protein